MSNDEVYDPNKVNACKHACIQSKKEADTLRQAHMSIILLMIYQRWHHWWTRIHRYIDVVLWLLEYGVYEWDLEGWTNTIGYCLLVVLPLLVVTGLNDTWPFATMMRYRVISKRKNFYTCQICALAYITAKALKSHFASVHPSMSCDVVELPSGKCLVHRFCMFVYLN